MRRAVELGRFATRGLAVRVLGSVLVAGLVGSVGAGGCAAGYSAGGPLASKDQYTFESTPTMPQSVSLIDTRSGETVWAMDIPVGQQLTILFKNTGKKANELGYDEMDWKLSVIGAPGRTLGNSMRVPPAYARRIDGSLREPEFGPIVASGVTPLPAAAPADGPAAPATKWDEAPTIDLPETEPPAAN